MIGAGAVMLFPVSLAVAAALWLTGYSDVGDGFSAGVVATLGAAMQYLALPRDQAARRVGGRWAWRLGAAGLLLVLALVLVPTWFGVAPVTHYPPPGAHVTSIGALKLHTSSLMDLGIAIAVYGLVVSLLDQIFRPRRKWYS